MPKAYSLDLRKRVVRFVNAGHSRHAAAAHFEVSVSFVINLMKAYHVTGSLTPRPSGGRRHAKLDPHRAFLLARVRENKLPTYQQLYNHLRSAIKKCGYEMKRPIHALRHTTATRTVNEEQDIQIAKELLGHKSVQTTLRYRHVSKEVRRARAKKTSPTAWEFGRHRRRAS